MPIRLPHRWQMHVLRAARKQDKEGLSALIRDYPQSHLAHGDDWPLLLRLQQSAPGMLETAFQAGLSPDSDIEADGSAPFQTFLQRAVSDGDAALVRLALMHGADPNRRNCHNETALGYAASWGQLEAARALVDAGADVNVIEHVPDTGTRTTPLDCTGGHPEVAAYLRSVGALTLAELELEEPTGSRTPTDPT